MRVISFILVATVNRKIRTALHDFHMLILKTDAFFTFFLFSGHEPIYFIENKEKTLRASYDRSTQIVDYMD